MRHLSQGQLLTPLSAEESSKPTEPRDQILGCGHVNNVAILFNLPNFVFKKRKPICPRLVSSHPILAFESGSCVSLSNSLFCWIYFLLNSSFGVCWNLGKIKWIFHISRTDQGGPREELLHRTSWRPVRVAPGVSEKGRLGQWEFLLCKLDSIDTDWVWTI